MTKRIQWVNENPGAPRDECGYWRSYEGRFHVSPNYRHTVNPDSYTVRDKLADGKGASATFDSVREAKAWAELRVTHGA